MLPGGGSGFHIQLSLEYYVFFQGSGLVVVIDATEWEYEKHMRHAKDRVVSVACIYCLFTWFILDLSVAFITVPEFAISQSEAVYAVMISCVIIKITISSFVIGLKNSQFPLIHLPSCIGHFVIGQFVIGQFNKPVTFEVVV